MNNQNPSPLLQNILSTLQDHKAEHICAYNVSHKVFYTDTIILVNAISYRHLKALSDYVEEILSHYKIHPKRIGLNQQSDWIILDAGLMVIHIFLEESRKHYDLDTLFS